MKLFNQFISATAIAVGTMGAASATCIKDNKPVACPPVPPPVVVPSPTTPTTSTVHNGGDADADAKAKAIAAAKAAAQAAAVAGGGSADAKGGSVGDINIQGAKYDAAAASAISSGVGTTGHGCFRGKGGFSLGFQTLGKGVSGTIGGGEEYEISKIKVIDAEGKEVEIEGNLCAIDQVNLATIAAGATPHATNGQIRLGAMTAAKASPIVDRAMRDIGNMNSMFDRQASGAALAPVSNTYQTVIVDKAGVTTTFNCPKGTKMVVDTNGAPVIDKATGLPICQPG